MPEQLLSATSTATATTAPVEAPPQPGCPLPADAATAATAAAGPVLVGPTGLGTSAARVVGLRDRGYGLRSWGDGTAPPLYCPLVDRNEPALAEEVEQRLATWARGCGFDDEEVDLLREAGFGRLVMLTHAGVDDPDRLLIAAQLNAGWWAADDLYADDSEMGATPTEMPPRLSMVMAAMDPVAPAGELSIPLDDRLRGDPVLVALRSGIDHLARHGSPAQVQRACYATFAMFVSWNAYAAWRHTGAYPPAWEYLAARQHDSFYTSMTLIDPVAGYELPANLYYDPRVRQALMQAGSASVMVNDLHSVAKDAADERPVCNMVLQLAADRGVSLGEATEITVELHNDLVRGFESSHRALRAIPSPELHAFLRGVQSWMGGGFEWHATNPRYAS